MKPILILSLASVLALSSPLPGAPITADHAVQAGTAGADAETQQRAASKADALLKAVELNDASKAVRARVILSDWFAAMWAWHKEHDARLQELWSEWNQARAVVPKDEFPGEIIAHKIDDVYASLKSAYAKFMERLSGELTPEQVEAIKERWSRSPGMMRTYNAYLEIVPDLSEAQKKVIYDRMVLAREDAMLTDSDREIVNIFKRHKVKVEAYVGTLEWAKLHRAYANRGKAAQSPQ